LSHALPLQKISSKSVHKFASNPTDRQTDRQTDRTNNIASFFGGGNNCVGPRREETRHTLAERLLLRRKKRADKIEVALPVLR